MYKKLKLVESANLTEAPEDDVEEKIDDIEDTLDTVEDMEDTIDSEEEQEENPVEEESELDKDLDELRDILVDLDLNLYQITSKEDKNNPIYIIGKVAEESDDVLMLIDTKPEEVNEPDVTEEEPIIDNIEVEEAEEVEDTAETEVEVEEPETDLEERFDFVKLPGSFEEINKLNPRYGTDLIPDHESIVEYLMNCLIEMNPEAAEELQNKKLEDELEIPAEPNEDNIDLDIDIDGEEEQE